MPTKSPSQDKSRESLSGAAKSPRDPRKTDAAAVKSAEREARLSEALRDNLRRRKAGAENSDLPKIKEEKDC